MLLNAIQYDEIEELCFGLPPKRFDFEALVFLVPAFGDTGATFSAPRLIPRYPHVLSSHDCWLLLCENINNMSSSNKATSNAAAAAAADAPGSTDRTTRSMSHQPLSPLQIIIVIMIMSTTIIIMIIMCHSE